MSDRSKISKIRLLLITAAIAAGVGSVSGTVYAEDTTMSEKDMYVQAVSLYEKLNGAEVDVPQAITDRCGSDTMGKAVVLGFANADEVGALSDSAAIRKQDAITILYKTIIDFDDSFALTSEEVDAIMEKCYDNALVDEKNRAGFAFMLKHKVIDLYYDTDPNKEITWDGCSKLMDTLYKFFVQNISFNMDGTEIEIGANIQTVTDIFGEPSRIDKGDYDFEWYVYNSDYSRFMMVGVNSGRICAFFSNSSWVSFGDIAPGVSMSKTTMYTEADGFRFIPDEDGLLDSIMYNSYYKPADIPKSLNGVRTIELADLINSYRANHSRKPVELSETMSETAADMASQPRYAELAKDDSAVHDKDGAHHVIGYDIFSVYERLVADENEAIEKDTKSIGIGTDVDVSTSIMSSVISDTSEVSDAVEIGAEGIATITPEQETEEPAASAQPTEEGASEEAPELPAETDTEFELISPAGDAAAVPADKDLEIVLDRECANEFLIKLYSYEDDEYIANGYFKPEGNTIRITKDLFTNGRDYKLSVSKVTDTAVSDVKEIDFTYGEVPEGALTINSLEPETVISDDHIYVAWDCELFHDFVVDIYDEEGKLLVSRPVNDAYFAEINNVNPGKYYICVTALRRSDPEVLKTFDGRNITVELPEPVITEYILDEGEEFYPVYSDEEMGLVYFYDEDIIDVETVNAKGKTVTQKKKKITQKQVKATDYYKMLAASQQQVDHFTGSDVRDLAMNEYGVSAYSYNMPMNIYSSETGSAIVEEAKKYLGIPYLWGGTTTDGFDCSGFAQYVYRNCGINISRVSQTQYNEGTPISRENLQPGDLVFFQKNGDVHHVGIYVGNGMMIHAPYTGTVIQYQSIDTSYYAAQFCGGRRIYSED